MWGIVARASRLFDPNHVNADLVLATRRNTFANRTESGLTRQAMALADSSRDGFLASGRYVRDGASLAVVAEVSDTRSGRVVGIVGPERMSPRQAEGLLARMAERVATSFVADTILRLGAWWWLRTRPCEAWRARVLQRTFPCRCYTWRVAAIPAIAEIARYDDHSVRSYLMRVLVVEDDSSIAGALVRGLRELSYAVDHAPDGEQASYLTAVNPYDVVVLDLALPRKDGIQVCREIRRRGSDTRILMLTARDGVRDRIDGLNSGADDYLVKPFNFDELVARIRALIRRKGEVLERVLTVADLQLDTHAQRATRAGIPLSLTTKEYALLEFLVRNVNRVVGRREISEHVWDDNYDPASNLIDSYINRLRRKVDREFDTPLIQTRRGAGYVLTSEVVP